MGNGALQVTQLQIQTSGRNLANSSTAGASRQEVVSTEGLTVKIGGGDMSVGVLSQGLTSARSQYLDTQVQNENSNLGYATQMDAFTEQAQDALSENLSSTQLDPTQATSQTGLISATTNFYNAWSALSADPSSANYRDAVSSAADSFVSTAQTVYGQIASVKQGTFTEANAETLTVNQLTSSIANYNDEIAKAELGNLVTTNGVPLNQASDLRDARQQAIEQLSGMVNVTVSTSSVNSSMVNIALTDNPSILLVSGADGDGTAGTSSLTVTGSDSTTGATGYAIGNSLSITATSASNGTTTAAITGGSIGGLLNMDNNILGKEQTSASAFSGGTTLLDRFNTYINNVVTSVNSAVTSGYNLNGTAVTTPFFTSTASGSTASTGAFDLNVNQVYDLNSTSYLSSGIPAASTSSGQLDGTLAGSIAASASNAGIQPYYQATVTTLASNRNGAAANLTSQTLLSTQVDKQRDSVSGISTNDETTDLLTFQRAFEASSKFINTIDEMYQTLINNLGS